jgi:hypothetical protein
MRRRQEIMIQILDRRNMRADEGESFWMGLI